MMKLLSGLKCGLEREILSICVCAHLGDVGIDTGGSVLCNAAFGHVGPKIFRQMRVLGMVFDDF